MRLDYERGHCYARETRSWQLPSAAVYQRWRPARSVAYQVVQQNLETWLARRRAGGLDAGADWVVDPVPAYVECALRKYLKCGILAHRFARVRCEKCGRDFVVAYSCKGRSVRECALVSRGEQLVLGDAGAGVETAI